MLLLNVTVNKQSDSIFSRYYTIKKGFPEFANDNHVMGWGRWSSSAYLLHTRLKLSQKLKIYEKIASVLELQQARPSLWKTRWLKTSYAKLKMPCQMKPTDPERASTPALLRTQELTSLTSQLTRIWEASRRIFRILNKSRTQSQTSAPNYSRPEKFWLVSDW